MTRTMRGSILILSFMAFARGVDYLTGNAVDLGSVWADHLNQPLVWGVACLILSAVGVFAAWRKCSTVGKWMGLVGMAIYVMFALQVFEMYMLPLPWPPEDARLITDHLGHAAMYGLVAVSLMWRAEVDKRKREILSDDGRVNG